MYIEELEQKLQQGIGLVKLHFPLLTALIVETRVSLDERVPTACVFPSGRILVSPSFIEYMNPLEVAYLIAHEILHLYYQTFERGKDFQEDNLVNVAHDFIINGELTEALGIAPPNGGLDWDEMMPVLRDAYYDDSIDCLVDEDKPIGEYNMEELMVLLKQYREYRKAHPRQIPKNNKPEPPPPPPPPSPWDELDKLGFPHSEPQPAPKQKDDAQKLREKRDRLDELLADDVRSTEEELELFPDERLLEIIKHTQNVQEGIRRAAAVKVALKRGDLLGKLDGDSLGHGSETGDDSWETGLLQGDYHTPWELALQKWFDDAAPRTRSWAHASRRQGDRNDISLPGHAREGWTLHIVLDTSGSMLDDLPRMLGAIEHFARGAHVTQVHLIQVDAEVTADDFIELDELVHFQALGCGGSDMSPAMQRLADDPTVQHVLVLTDGYVDYPPSVPYDVVWAVPPEYANFEPSYGKVIPIERE